MAEARILCRLTARILLLTALWLIPASFGWAQTDSQPASTEIHNALRGIKSNLDQHALSPAELSATLDQVTALKARSTACQQDSQEALDRAQQAETAIGPQQPTESADIAKSRSAIAAFKAKASNRLAECRLDTVFADGLITRINQAQQSLLEQHLTERGPPLWTLGLETATNPQIWASAGLQLVATGFDRWSVIHLALVIVLVASLALLLGQWGRRSLRKRLAHHPAKTFTAELMHGLLGAFSGYLAIWAPVAAVAATLFARDPAGAALSLPTIIAISLTGLLSAKILIRGFLAPFPPARQVTGLTDDLARLLARRLSVLAGIMGVGGVLWLAPLRDSLPADAFNLTRGVFVAVLVVNLGWLTWLVGLVPRLRLTGGPLRLILLAGLGGILAAELLGYRVLAGYLLRGLMETLPIGAGLWLANGLINETCARLDGAREGWAGQLRHRLGLQAEEGFPGLLWLRLLLTAMIWGGAVLLLLRAWGLSDTGTALIMGYLTDGIAIGDVRFIPTKMLTGIFIFVVLLAVARWLRDWIETKWLSRSRMDHGAKNAVVTMTGYAGFVAAALVALSAAGVNLANLAIIASALSVGIGFGLQNIVSNFVAGLILLFERPIKTGDWVVVGSTEGIVKRIGVRGTEIRTSERSDVTVPNSDLITAHVKNWTLRDTLGQGVVPLSVAYGSDTELVRKLLLDIARAQPEVISDSRQHPIKVQFRGFGDSALTFELHFIVRHVERRSDVISDINFAIDKAFREHGIEIPFPQRELRIRDWPGSAAALTVRNNGEAESNGIGRPPHANGA